MAASLPCSSSIKPDHIQQVWASSRNHHRQPCCGAFRSGRSSQDYRPIVTAAAAASSKSNDGGQTSSSSTRAVPAVRRNNDSLGPAQLLHKAEFAAISVAAVCQSAVLVSTAFCQWQQTRQLADLQDQLHNIAASEGSETAGAVTVHAQQKQHQHQQQHQQHQQQHHAIMQLPHQAAAAATGLHLVTSSALVVGLLCGAGLRQLQLRQHSAAALKPSADAAVRLAALEVASQQIMTQLSTTARQMDKLQARVRLATSDIKQPMKVVQGAAAQQAAALLKLAEQQAALQQQVDGSQELIAALQGVAAKQFKVSAEALQQLKQGQGQLSTGTTKALNKLQQQQSTVLEQLKAQQWQLQVLEQSVAAMQQQQVWQQAAAAADLASPGSSIGLTGRQMPPDPWQPTAHSDTAASDGTHRSSSGSNGHARTSNVVEQEGLNGSQTPAASAV